MRGNHSSHPGRSQRKNFEFASWALTLARLRRSMRRRILTPREASLVLRLPAGVRRSRHRYRRLWAWRFTRPFVGLPILLAGSPAPPSPSRRPALGATVSSLGVGGSKWFLASFEQTPSADEADEPLDGHQTCDKLVLGPRKLRTSDGQASDAESLAPLRGASSNQLSLHG